MQLFDSLRRERPKGVQLLYVVVSGVGILLVIISLLTVSFGWLSSLVSGIFDNRHNRDWTTLCQQPEVLDPPSIALGLRDASQFLTKDYRNKSANLLAGAVQIPTESFDDMNQDPLKDARFEVFKDLHVYLEHQFPLVSQHLEYVNSYGLLYTLKGSRDGKPVVLMAHQDVVPVERSTLDEWTHGAFSGFYDGEYIWGRGALDTKSSLVAILEATESLLAQNWTPQRTVIISFGFDEELDGSRGALSLANLIRKRYGEIDSLHMIIDEGSGVMETEGSTFAFIGVSEKGYTDINIEVNTPGGHSSIPPDHTGIGIVSEIVTRLEDSHIKRDAYKLAEDDLVAEMFSCVARYGENLSRSDRKDLLDVKKLRNHLRSDNMLRGLIGTTQAVDVVDGGVKVNALPEKVTVTVNYRIDVHETVAEVTARVQEIVEEVADKFGLGVVLNGEAIYDETDHGFINIFNGQSLEVASISPFTTDSDYWNLIAGTSRHVLQEWFGLPHVPISPVLLTGNTDTWRYQGLTPNIYRYTLGLPKSGSNAHTVDEYISIESHLAAVIWYYEMLQFF